MNRSRQAGKKPGQAQEMREETKRIPKPKRCVKGDIDSRWGGMEVMASEVQLEKIQKEKWEFDQPFSDPKSTKTSRVSQEGENCKTKAQSQNAEVQVQRTVSRLT